MRVCRNLRFNWFAGQNDEEMLKRLKRVRVVLLKRECLTIESLQVMRSNNAGLNGFKASLVSIEPNGS